MSTLDDLLFYANERELEKTIYPLWLAHYLFANLAGAEAVEYGDMVSQVKGSLDHAAPNASRSAEQILKDFGPIVDQYRQRQRKEV